MLGKAADINISVPAREGRLLTRYRLMSEFLLVQKHTLPMIRRVDRPGLLEHRTPRSDIGSEQLLYDWLPMLLVFDGRD